MKPLIRLHPHDNVAIALAPIIAGQKYEVDGYVIGAMEDIDKGHKVALVTIPRGEPVLKYGAPIGVSVQTLQAGAWVHTEQITTRLNDELEYRYQPESSTVLSVADDSPEVRIYRRSGGQIGIRNELWVIPTVGCVNGTATQMVKGFLAKHPDLQIDGVHAFPHQFGCSQLGEDLKATQKLLQSMASHPNAGGVLVVGLGCENNQIAHFRRGVQGVSEERVKYLNAQDVEDEVRVGLSLMEELYDVMKGDQRESGCLSEVRFGLECGGSDGLSGVTANPLLGQLSDYLTARGGTTVLTEVPEMFGAETILMSRCKDKQTFDELVAMVNGFKRYYRK